MINCIGLFGTCDDSVWRESFMIGYDDEGYDYFNPQLQQGQWNLSVAVEENMNIQNDTVLVFPVLSESIGVGSLSEIGFAVNTVMQNVAQGNHQHLIVLIDDECDANVSPADIELSNRTRSLVKSNLSDISHSNIHVVNTLIEMYDLSIALLDAQTQLNVAYQTTVDSHR